MEMRMNPVHLPEALSFNYDELKAMIAEKVAVYEMAVYSPEQMAAAKADRAALNHLKTALNNERLRQEREYMRPFREFKAQVDELIKIIDAPVAAIDKQVKAFEERKREEKRQQIEELFAAAAFPVAVRLDQIFEQKWLNASVSMKAIQETIAARIEQVQNDLAVVRALPEYAFEAEAKYLSCLDLAAAVSEAHRRSDEAKRKAEWQAMKERVAAEAEARRQAAPAPATPAEPAAKPSAPSREWLRFRAYMTVDDARALRDFFLTRGIEFDTI